MFQIPVQTRNGTAWDKLSENIDLSGYVPTSRTINGKALTGNISLTASDVSALPSSTVIPTVVNTYSATGTDAISGKGVKAALDTLSIPENTSDLTNDSGFITGITKSDVTTALGYTPYNSTNPNGYTSNVGTITGIKMNGASKGTSGVVDLGTVITDISGKQDVISSTNKLSADLLSEGTTNKLVSASEKTTWNGKQNALSSTQLANITAAGTALQPNNNISELTNDAGYITDSALSGLATDSLVMHLAGTETITGNKTFSGTVALGANATATTPATSSNSTAVATTAFVKAQGYLTSLSNGTGISVSGNTITNTGVTAIAEGSTNGAISVTANGSTSSISVHGLGSAAYAATTDFAAASHNQASSTINALTGYTIATSSQAITATDSLNTALGKLEYKCNNATVSTITVGMLSGS